VHTRLLFTVLFLIAGTTLNAQLRLRGTVYDNSRNYTVESVLVQTNSGGFTQTDKLGNFSIPVNEQDSVWFVYEGRPTRKYAVKTIPRIDAFEIALNVPVKGMYKQLKEVVVHGRNYRMDSIRNRQDYAKVFNYRRPNLETMTNIGPGGAGIDINELIRAFQFRRNRSMLRFQARLMQQEADRFIDYRFNKTLVRQLTGLEGDALQQFMQAYRPTLEFTESASEYDFRQYIKTAFGLFQGKKAF